MDYSSGVFQDFVGHAGEVNSVKFSAGGEKLTSSSYGDIMIWGIQF